MSTIRDIARKAGVSVSTASLALNGDTRVRPQTRARVQAAAQALDYHPSRAARSLSSGRSYALQVLNPVADASLSSGFFTRFVHGVHDYGRLQNYAVALTVLSDEAEAEKVLAKLIYERWADGIIWMNPTDDEELIALLESADFPYVVIGRSPEPHTLTVDNDNVAVAYEATRHLIERGRLPPLLLCGPQRFTFIQDRAHGFETALREVGMTLQPEWIQFIEGSAEAARYHLARLLADGLEVGGVVAVSDALAVGAMRAIKERGLRIPEEIAVVGMNNDELTEYLDPRLSSVELNAYQLGSEAAAILLERIAGEATAPLRRLVPHQLIVRETS